MKGVIFTEFLELVEDQFGLATTDHVIRRGCPFHGGYTSVGTYDYRQLLGMVGSLSELTGIEGATLVRTFGHHLFQRFLHSYPDVFRGIESTAELMKQVESTIHVEVRKLNPDAELPAFDFSESPAGETEIVYRSTRPFAVLAEGLLEASIQHFGEALDVERQDLAPFDGTTAKFTLRANVRSEALSPTPMLTA